MRTDRFVHTRSGVLEKGPEFEGRERGRGSGGGKVIYVNERAAAEPEPSQATPRHWDETRLRSLHLGIYLSLLDLRRRALRDE